MTKPTTPLQCVSILTSFRTNDRVALSTKRFADPDRRAELREELLQAVLRPLLGGDLDREREAGLAAGPEHLRRDREVDVLDGQVLLPLRLERRERRLLDRLPGRLEDVGARDLAVVAARVLQRSVVAKGPWKSSISFFSGISSIGYFTTKGYSSW